ncbi:5-hydroxytryptamine receptor 3A-like [Eucyclogobius newberryi]|uniref:5-hydroxytryptamine receptor 3A-like n=1 Tax=Eucyclogobius newberryi TaxID=166745 RepID=UPI003B591152
MATLRIATLLTVLGLCHSLPPGCSYWKLWDHLNLTTTNTFVANVRPVKSWTSVTTVHIEMVLFSILKLDEKSQTLQVQTWTTTYWSNEFVMWNSADFCGIKVITVPRSMVWIPDINIEEDVSDTSSSQLSPYVNLQMDGWAVTTSRQLLTFTCQLNLKQFPFDQQTCNITFSSMTADAKAIVLKRQTNNSQLTENLITITQGEWDLQNIQINETLKTVKHVTQSQLIYKVTVRRKPMLYVINFIIPLFYFLILDLASFFIHESRGEKLGFKITILLSISVLLLILKDMLPSTEKMLPWIANYCIGIFALVGMSVFEAMTIGFLLSFEENVNESPQHLPSCEEDIQLERTCSRDPLVLTVAGEVTKATPPPASASTECQLLRQILHQIQSCRQELEHSGKKTTRPRFKRLALVIDSIFFVLYFLTVWTFVIYMYTVWAKRYFENYTSDDY